MSWETPDDPRARTLKRFPKVLTKLRPSQVQQYILQAACTCNLFRTLKVLAAVACVYQRTRAEM